jgi:hypothetical protein
MNAVLEKAYIVHHKVFSMKQRIGFGMMLVKIINMCSHLTEVGTSIIDRLDMITYNSKKIKTEYH